MEKKTDGVIGKVEQLRTLVFIIGLVCAGEKRVRVGN